MNIKELEQMMRAGAAPAVAWESAQEKRLSKLGGLPDVKPGFTWPQWKGDSLAFLAQFDLGELPSVPPSLSGLPQTGILYFFYDKEQSTWGFDPQDRGSWCIVYEPDSTGLEQATCPADLENDEVYTELPIAPRIVNSFPSDERLNVDLSDLWQNESFYEEYETLVDTLRQESSPHRMGGFPNITQSDDMESECQLASNGIYLGGEIRPEDQERAESLVKENADWRLLLQLDTEDDADMMWGDCGALYFWIRAEDLARQDFSRCWMVLQGS